MSAPITIKGRIGKDPEIKFTPSNMAVVALSVVSNGRKQVNGQWQDVDTSWWECKAFGAYAEAIVDTIARGDLITITGTIKQTVWVDKAGNKRSSYEVLVDSIAKQVKAEKYHGTKPREKNSDATQWDPTDAVF
jgi:single-strand DNA-binding protein